MTHKTVASLFSGIGGFEAGFAAAGLKTSLMREKDAAAKAVLSLRAAEGFLRRYIKSGLTKNQDFARALATHCGLQEVPA
jgi:site-specific DNA-cytosine methylase